MKIKYIISYILGMGIMLSGCELVSSIDDIKMENTLTDEILISDANSAETALLGVYAGWRDISIGWFIHNLSMLSGSVAPIRVGDYTQFMTGDIRFDNTQVLNNYRQLYYVINQANSLIAQIENKETILGLSQERKEEILAEATFHRAYAHFQLLRQFGEFTDMDSKYGVVLYDKPVRDNTPKARATVANSYKMIIADLVNVIKKAPEQVAAHYNITRVSTKALLSKVYLSKGDYALASQYANEAIADGKSKGIVIEENYLDIFKNGASSKEMLFVIYTHNSFEKVDMLPLYISVNPPVGTVATKKIAEDISSLFETDPRFDDIYSPEKALNPGYPSNKYAKSSWDNKSVGNPLFLLRMGEMYYVAAEAETRQGNFDKARMALKPILARAGYPLTYTENLKSEDLLLLILKHKWLELTTENNEDWFDLVRYKAIDGLAIAPYFKAKEPKMLLPIPQTARAGNSLLEQNPGYNE